MALKFEKGKETVIDAVISRIKHHPHDTAAMCAEFARQFYGTVALEDLKLYSADDLYAALMHFWGLIARRTPHETKICIYNPTQEADGWQSTHTVIEILMEDMPFLVDSVRMVIDKMGLVAHLIIHMGGVAVERNDTHDLIAVLPKERKFDAQCKFIEAPIWVQIDKQTSPELLQRLHENLQQALADNRAAVEDWGVMRNKVQEVIEELAHQTVPASAEILEESKDFLTWINNDHFTFLGTCDYQVDKKHQGLLKPIPHTGLGILREKLIASRHETLHGMLPETKALTESPASILVMSKTNRLATVHRNIYEDYIGIKRFNAKGEFIGERRIIGLYTAIAYNTNPKNIPFLRHKVEKVMQSSDLNPKGHAGKVLLNILDTLPRDDLIQASEDELLEMAMGIFHMQERKRVRLFARTDVYGRFISCLVYVPKDRFHSELRSAFQAILAEAFHSENITFSTRFSESVLARIHFLVRLPSALSEAWDFKAIEQKLIEVGRSWIDDLHQSLLSMVEEERANQLFSKYKNAFSSAYSDNFTPQEAVFDIQLMESLTTTQPLVLHFYQDPEEKSGHFRLKVFQHYSTIPLSEILPIIERLGLRALSERPYCLHVENTHQTWISEFSLVYPHEITFKLEDIQARFQEAFIKIWAGEAENDGFNQLILSAGLDWRQVSILRAYAKYFKQIRFTFSQEYIEATFAQYAELAYQCVKLFELRFSPELTETIVLRQRKIDALSEDILKSLDQVSNLDEDKILRQFVHAIRVTLRTNYYQTNAEGQFSSYLSFKFACKLMPGVPKPHPLYEIFFYSPRVEGVHLRGGKVARGGLRWSDRREDFRTEVLGLMKAQQVKNAIIVPNGAKGGFVPKHLPVDKGREAVLAEGVVCYQLFIQGLLDITDNYEAGEIVKPKNVICYDEDDPYLVVAADKGTATFSDYANAIALHYGFWLGDAFASGGSVGYDHKKMGITARGAWESVRRHFYEMGRDFSKDFTVVGIGDMAGDVFGNGMLLSEHIKLVAAFNHMHIFIDPMPDPKLSFKERERLFYLPRSTWADYDEACISSGGGVFERSSKSIPLSKEMKALLGIKKNEIEPNECIRLLLQANVDMLWSAGIGTFVKGEQETHADVGDRANDATRVDAKQLRCKLIGEGGNLGLTQQARIEYALNGGLVYTDFIDNSAGVNCSDKEVNIKILLNSVMSQGDLTIKQRNALLASMTEEVAALVLQDNIGQTRAISLAASQPKAIDLHIRYIHALEQAGKLDRKIENIPDDKALMEHKLLGKGLGLPSISALQCYSKILLKEQLLETDLPEDAFLDQVLVQAFPKKLHASYEEAMKAHPLRREIIVTKLSNMLVNEMGFTFVYRIRDETGASVAAIVRAYFVVRTILSLDTIWEQIDALGAGLKAEREKEILLLYLRLVRRLTRWFLQHYPELNIQEAVDRYRKGVKKLKQVFPKVLAKAGAAHYQSLKKGYLDWGISESLAHELTITRPLFSALDLIEASYGLNKELTEIAEVYFEIGERLDISWIRSQVIAYPTETVWESLSREAIRDDLDAEQRQLTELIFKSTPTKFDIDEWMHMHAKSLTHWAKVVASLKASSGLNYTMFFVAARDLRDLIQRIGKAC